eukprot:9514310-Alexandrium_andersonii.AAC.1
MHPFTCPSPVCFASAMPGGLCTQDPHSVRIAARLGYKTFEGLLHFPNGPNSREAISTQLNNLSICVASVARRPDAYAEARRAASAGGYGSATAVHILPEGDEPTS